MWSLCLPWCIHKPVWGCSVNRVSGCGKAQPCKRPLIRHCYGIPLPLKKALMRQLVVHVRYSFRQCFHHRIQQGVVDCKFFSAGMLRLVRPLVILSVQQWGMWSNLCGIRLASRWRERFQGMLLLWTICFALHVYWSIWGKTHFPKSLSVSFYCNLALLCQCYTDIWQVNFTSMNPKSLVAWWLLCWLLCLLCINFTNLLYIAAHGHKWLIMSFIFPWSIVTVRALLT